MVKLNIGCNVKQDFVQSIIKHFLQNTGTDNITCLLTDKRAMWFENRA